MGNEIAGVFGLYNCSITEENVGQTIFVSIFFACIMTVIYTSFKVNSSWI
jgi:hypothetical protein